MYLTLLLFNLAASQPATEWKTWLISSLTVILAVGAGVVAVCVIQAKRRVRVPSPNICISNTGYQLRSYSLDIIVFNKLIYVRCFQNLGKEVPFVPYLFSLHNLSSKSTPLIASYGKAAKMKI